MADAAPEREADLVRACADGDREAWARFVDRYGRLIAALARRILARRSGRAADADVEEVAANVFLALVQGERRLLRRYRPEFRVSTYLGVIVRTEALRYLRRAAGAPATSLSGADESGREVADVRADSPPEAAAESERQQALRGIREALAELPSRDRLLLTMRFVDGLDYAAIAEVLRVSPESVGQLLRRAKDRLGRRVPHLAAWVEGGQPLGEAPGGDRGGRAGA